MTIEITTMASIALLIYIILYFIVSAALFIANTVVVDPADQKSDRPWETPVDLLLLTLAFAGMIMLYLDVTNSGIRLLWKPLSVIIAAAQVYLNISGRRRWAKSTEATTTKQEARFADVATLLRVVPPLILNVVFAFQ